MGKVLFGILIKIVENAVYIQQHLFDNFYFP